MPFFVYVLKCADDSLYCGYAKDLQARVKLHSIGRASKYTRSRLPVRLVYSKKFSTKSQAMRREAAIKKLSRKEKLELIKKVELSLN